MYISKDKLSDLHLGELNPSKLIDQLKFCPDIFNFLKSKEISLGKIRPIITYMICFTIWILRQTTTKKRETPEGFYGALWDKFSADKKVAKLAGDIVEALEPELWNFFLNILEKEIQREENITKEEIGTGALVFAIIVIGLIYSFGNDETLQKLTKLLNEK